ncbi:uncharacterized protein LOC135848952 isoform X1 [Planococcus citri]|uniref:uncharacterized protein LOC135848952 isoform X1 n=1 Tax=Planococcus citri TaxID=170843 RepID=UPI0031F8325C
METTGIDLENKYTYFQPIPRLEDMACLAVALKTWDYYYSHCRKMRYEYNKLEKVHKIINNIEVPKRIEKKIKTVCEKIYNKMSHHRYKDIIKMCNCYEYEIRPFFDTIDRSTQDSDDSKQRSFFPYGFVWDSNGNINDKKTAEKALSCPRRLNDNDLMFTIIAKYSLENYIEDFPISSLSEKFLEHVNKADSYREHRMTDYWIKYKRKSTDPYSSNFLFNWTHSSLLDGLKSADEKLDWPVYEHFWIFFDEEEQLIMAGNFIQYLWYQKYQMIVFSKLTRYQLKCLYLEQPVIIVLNFFAMREEELAKAAWERVKFAIGGERFADLLGMIRRNEQRSRDDTVQFLIYLWNSATDDLVEYIAIEKECCIADDVIYNFNSSSICESPYTVEFLKAVLLRTTLKIRQDFFRCVWPDLLLNDFHTFDSLIEDCLSSSTQQQEIKEEILINTLETEHKTKILIRLSDLVYSNLDEFYKFLTFFTPNPDLQKRLKIRLLRSGMLSIKGIWRAENWTKLFKFLDELYPNPKVAHRKKRKIVFSFWRENGNYMDIYRPNGDEKFTEVDNLLTQCLTPEEIRISKEKIIDNFQQLFSSSIWYRSSLSLKRMNIPRFVSWCYCGDEDKVERFRSTFRIHEAFHSLMREIVERYINGRDACLSFSSLEELIRWRFSTKRKKIKKFKRRNIHNIVRSEVKESSLWKKYRYPYVIKKIIIWAFDGDKSKIREFKQLYQKEDLMKIIHWLHLEEETTDCAEYYGHTSNESE